MPPKKSALPVRAEAELHIETSEHEVSLQLDTRRYRVRGLEKNLSSCRLRVNLMVARDGLVHLDTLDLYQARSRAAFIKAAAAELFVEEPTIKHDVGRILLALEKLQHEQIEATQPRITQVELTASQQEDALGLLTDPNLIERISEDYTRCGMVGEETNRLVCYLACVSRHLAQPLAILIQSASAAGKTTLMDATLSFMPSEHQIRYSAMTGQSLYYMGQQNLKHKILAIAEEEGVAQAGYALKLLQSDGRLRIAATGKNQGRTATENYEVEGPVMMFLTTTAAHPDPELQNRCLTLHVDESPQQTAAIQARQRAAYTLEGQKLTAERERITQRHQNAQRLLEPLPVILPWAEQLTFRHDQTRMRRDHAKYLSLIAAITLLHQHQRPRIERGNGSYLEAIPEDAVLASKLIREVMGQSFDDLLPQTRQLLRLLDDYVTERSQTENRPRCSIRFTQREIRETLGWGDFQLRRHLTRLVELEYVLVYRTGRGNAREYELLYHANSFHHEQFFLNETNPKQLQAIPSSG